MLPISPPPSSSLPVHPSRSPLDQGPCRIVYETVHSRALADNALGDPTERLTPVILPPSYDQSPDRRYPVIYVLSSFASTGWQLLSRSPLAEAFDERLARLYAGPSALPDTPPLSECIYVLPDCFTSLGGSQYVNSPYMGHYEDHIVREVVPLIDQRYRTLPAAAHRGIVGRSSGGIGALWLAMNHPAVFGAVASHAGDGAFRVTMPHIILPFCRKARRMGGPAALLRHWLSLGKGPRGGDLFDPMTVLASAAAYSPDPSTDLGFALPFDPHSGELDESVFARWLRFDPVEICLEDRYRHALSGMRLIYLDAGVRDEYFLDFAARAVADRLRSARIDVMHEEFDDGHRSTNYRYDRSLPLLAAALSG